LRTGGAGPRWAAQTTEVVTLAAYSFAFVFGTFLTLVILFYFLTGGPQLARGAIRLIPPQQRALIQHIAARIDPVLKRYIIGVVLVVIYATNAEIWAPYILRGTEHVNVSMTEAMEAKAPQVGCESHNIERLRTYRRPRAYPRRPAPR
jgi:hypothetical protein